MSATRVYVQTTGEPSAGRRVLGNETPTAGIVEGGLGPEAVNESVPFLHRPRCVGFETDEPIWDRRPDGGVPAADPVEPLPKFAHLTAGDGGLVQPFEVGDDLRKTHFDERPEGDEASKAAPLAQR